MAITSFENKIYKSLKGSLPQGLSSSICVSGGMDSLVMAQTLINLRQLLKLENLSVIHIHHGLQKGSSLSAKTTNEFRLKAWKKAKNWAAKVGLPFLSNLQSVSLSGGRLKYSFLIEPKDHLKNEDQLREFRHLVIQNLVGDRGVVFMGHHRDDQLENQLIRLIRGTGPNGLGSMEVISEAPWGGAIVRPLLGVTKSEIGHAGSRYKLRQVTDPSNKSLDPLRNWIRHQWLPLLEEKRPGGSANISRSLDLISEALKQQDLSFKDCLIDGGVCLSQFRALSTEKKAQVLAIYLRDQKFKSYAHSHVLEIIKRLDTSKRRLNFRLLRRQWIIDQGLLKALPTAGS